MSTTNTVSIEALRLRLIEGSQSKQPSPLLMTKEGVQTLIKALAYADSAFAAEIEHLLVQIGESAVPQLIKGLFSTNQMVRSVCAMSLIRLGSVAEPLLLVAYQRAGSAQWVFNFIFEELGLPYTLDTSMMAPVALNQASH